MARLTIHLFGTPHLELDGAPLTLETRKALALLAYLALTRRRHSRDALAAMFWPDTAEARTRLRRTLAGLNAALPADSFEAERATLALAPRADIWIDVLQFETLVSTSQASNSGDGEQLALLAEAASLYSDDLLSGFSLNDSPLFDEWQLNEAERLRRLALGVFDQLAEIYHARNDHANALAHARRRLELDPLDEHAQRRVIRLLGEMGERAAALRLFEDCAARLDHDLSVTPEAETLALVEQIRSGALPVARRTISDTQPNAPARRLPQPLTPLLGRTAERVQIAAALADPGCRLLTLVGAGGMGKTRLAIDSAITHRGNYLHGACFVTLPGGSSAEQTAEVIAAALDLQLRENRSPILQLHDYLRAKKLLLVLDNCDQLAQSTNTLSDLLVEAPQLIILATSRARLNLPGERVLPIGPLPLGKFAHSHQDTEASVGFRPLSLSKGPKPAPSTGSGSGFPEPWTHAEAYLDTYGRGAPEGVEEGSGTETGAIDLFIDRAQRALPTFVPAVGDRIAIAQICQALGGMPLAIELAATWTPLLSCAEIAAEIVRDLDLLATAARNLPPRQRSIRAMFDASWQRLSLVDRDGLLNLALFCGSFDREAAAQVAGVQLPTLFALLDAALIQRDGSGRYTLHELLRRYLTERLAADSTRTAELGARHANCFSVLLSTHLQQHIPLSTALAQLKPIVDDVRAAWRWAVANDALILLDTMLPYLDRYYKVRSAYQEAADTFGAAIVSLATRPASVERRTMLARLRACCGAALGRLGRYAEGTAMLDAALPDLAHYGSPAARLMALVPRGEIAYASGDLATVQACVDAIEAHLDTVDDPGTRGRIWQSLGWLWGNLRQYHKARRAHNESLALMEILDDEHGMAAALNSLGIVTSRLGDVPRARGYHERSLQLAEQIGFQFGVLVAVNNLGTLAFESGDYAAAEAYYQAALAQFRDLGYRSNIAGALINLGIAAKEQHDTQHARRYFVEARQVSIDAGHQKLATHADFELADLAASDGEITYAEASYRRCLAFWEQSGDLTMESLTQRRLGGLALQRADLQHARVALQAALQLAHQVEEQGLMADVLLLAAELLQRREAHTQAAEILDAIIQAEGVRHSDRQIALTRRAALAHIPRTTADSTQSLHTCIAHLLNEGMH